MNQLLPEATLLLEAHRRRELALRASLGRRVIGADEWIFQTINGDPLCPRAFSKRFARLIAKIGLGIRLHDLRHSYGTLANAAGVPLETISRSLGHSSVGVTDKIYVHRVEQLQRNAAELLNATIGQAVRAGLGAEWGDASEAEVPQRCHKEEMTSVKPRHKRERLVAGPGFEPGTFGL